MKTLKSIIVAALCAVGLSASALPPSPYRDIWSSTPDPQAIKDPTDVIDWCMSSRTFESPEAKHGKFLEASADAMIAAYSARIAKDDTDYEAYICRAFAYLKKAGENQAFFDLAQEFGYTFDNDTMHFTGELIQKKGVTPEMNDATAEICDILLPLMKSAYADLVAIPYNWKGCVAITPDVYPVDEAVYFDWADVLMSKAALAEMMCILNMVKGFDVTMDSDLLEYTFNSRSPKNGKRGVQPILENNPDFLSKVRDQKALTEAGNWWASAATLLDQWDKAHAKRSDGKMHFFDWNFEKMDDNTVTCYDWLHKHRDGLINLPYWASPFDYTLMNGDSVQFWTLQPLFAGKFLREHFPEFGVGVKEPWCNEPMLDTLPDSTLCGIYPGVSRTYLGNLMTNVRRAGDFTTIPPYTPDSASSVHAIWYDNLFELGFDNTGNPAMFAWESQSPLVLLDPEFNVRGVTAVFTGWSFSGYPNGHSKDPETWEGSEISTPFQKESPMYKERNVVATANFAIPKVTYLDFEGGKLSERTDECELVKADTTTFEAGKVYAVPVDVTITNRITVSGMPASPAKLVLCDGVTLSAAKGIEVAADSALVICGQALGTGMLEATGSSGTAGIGGDVTINGGTVIATGVEGAAGIGGGTVTINAGTVTAVGGSSAAGIGGTVKFADGTAYGVAAGADEANALYMTAAAYAADHSAAYVALPYFSLKIPEATEGYSYEVSSMGAQPKAALANQTNTYAIATGATARVLFTPGEDYVWVKAPVDNPMIIAKISGDTVVDAADLPTTKFVKKGSAGNPWAVGYSTRDSVTAWTNGTDKLVVEGAGNMDDFTEGNPAPWGTGITEVEIGEDVTGIGARAFEDSKLGSVTIPASVTSIGAAAFFGSTSLSNVVVEAMTPSALGEGAFVELAEGYKIIVPQGTGAAYKAAPDWSLYADSIFEQGSPECPWEIGEGVTAYMNGTELVIQGTGTISDLSKIPDDVKSVIDAITITTSNVTGAANDAFAGFDGIVLTLPEGWSGDCPDADGKWYGATGVATAGSKDAPWTIGEGVTAYTNDTELVIGGAGTISDLSKISDDVKSGIDAITITTNGVTGAEAEAFAGIGGGNEVKVTLPENWQGELPDADGKLYGMKVDMSNFMIPLAVKNVTFLQRYPWNGLADIKCDVSGAGTVTLKVTTLTNDVTFVGTPTLTGETTIDLDAIGGATNGVKFVWDAAVDLLAGFKAQNVKVEVKIAGSVVSAVSTEGFLDLTVGDRIAADEETIVVDPAWDETDPSLAKVFIDGEEEPRQYTVATNDTWETAALEPGRYELEMQTSCSSYPAIFWKLGDDWVVFDGSNITADVTFEANKTYLVLGTNTVAGGANLTVTDRAKFEYAEGAGFKGGPVDLPIRYEQKSVEDGLFQIVEKIKGCEDNPWEVGDGVEAYTNDTELVIGGAGTISDLSKISDDVKSGIDAITITTNGVTGAGEDAFAGIGGGSEVKVTLPENWQGELPDADGKLYGMKVDMSNFMIPLAVKNVKFLQRYPWNGLVDIRFTVTGSAGATNVVVTVKDGSTEVTNITEAATIPAGGVLEANLVWDATTAGFAAEFKSDAVTAEVALDGAPAISAKSAAGTVDLRDDVPLDEGAVTVASVGYSDTAWGTEPEAKVTLGWTNETTGATGVIATGLEREGAVEVDLPKQNGDYVLTHSTGDLKSFATFVVSGYPIGSETNPWKVGTEGDPDGVVAWTDGNGNVYFKPPRSSVSREGLETITNAMGGTGFDMELVSADGTATNDVKMIIGAGGKQYTTFEDMFASDDDSFKFFDVTGCVVTYDGMGAAGSMATETFLPGIETNLTANAFTAVGYVFQGWSTNGGIRVVFRDRAAIDDPQPGDIYELTAVWKSAPVTVTTFEQLKDALAAAAQQGAEMPVTINVSGTITVPYGEKVELPGDPSKAEVVLTGSGTIKGYVKKGGNLVVSTNVKVLPWTVGKGVTARLDENGTLHIEGKGKMNDFTDANPAPWAGVASDIKAIEVAEGVTKLGNAAFIGLDFMDTTSTLAFADGGHELNLLAFVSSDGSVTNAPWTSQFRMVRDDTSMSAQAFGPKDSTAHYGSVGEALTSGDTMSMLLLTLADSVNREKDYLTGIAGDKPYSKQMQGFLDEAFAKLDDAEGYGDVVDVHQDYADQIEQQAAKDESHTIAGTKITWRVLDGSLVIEGEGEMPGFVEPDYPEGAPWNERQADITSATVAAGITSVGDAAFAECPANGEASVLFKDPGIELNLGAFVSGDGTATNVPTVKVEIVTVDEKGEHKLRVIPGGWTNADDPNVTYGSLAEAIEDGATAVVAAFEKKTDAGDVVVPPTEVEEIVTVTDGTGAKTELTAKFVNDANGLGSDGEVGLATDVENIAASLEALSSNIVVTVKLESSGTMDVALSNECESVKAGFAPDAATLGFASHNFDIDVAWSCAGAGGELTELPYSIVAHIPMTVYDGFVYSVSRLHGGAFEALPEWTAETADSVTAEWFKVDVANGEIVIKTRLFCPFAIGVLELEKSCTVTVNDGSKTLGEADPSSLATNIEIVVTGPINKSDFAGYAKRKAGEATGAYPINFVMTEKMPAGFPAGSFTVIPGVFTILMGDGPAATGTVKYPATVKVNGVDTGLLREKAFASWAATADKGSVFAGWIAADGAPECVTNKLAVLTENELRKSPLAFRVEEGEQVAPTAVEATWARIDDDMIESVTIDTNGLHVTTKSFVTASVSGLPSGLRFNAKTLAITGAVKAADKTYSVKVSVKNASGYTWKQSFGFTVVNNAVTEIVPADDCVTTGVPVMVRCDPAMGKVSGAGVYALGKDGTKKVLISASAKTDYVFAGWYKDPGFSEPAEFWTGSGRSLKQKDYREVSQSITVTGPTYLYARFVEKSTTADPIVWLRYTGAGYCGVSASFLDEEETWYQGVALPTNACMIAFGSASLPTVTVSGLPSGVKFDKNTLRFTGVPTTVSTEKKPFFTVKISVKNRSGATDMLVRNVKVEPLPAWVVGNFDGYHIEGGATNGTFTATVGTTGKVSGKTVGGYAATTFSAANFVDVFTLDGSSLIYAVDVTVSYKDPSTRKTVKQTDTLYLMEDPETGLGTIGGGDGDGCGAVGVQRAWDRKDLAFPAFDTTALRTPFALDNGITLKFGANGKVMVAGKVTGDDGSPVSVSGSTYVLPLAWRGTMTPNLLSEVYVFSAPKRNLVEGVSEMYGFLLSVGEGGKFDTLSPVPQELVPEIHAGPVVPIIH